MRRVHSMQNAVLAAVILGELIFLIGHALFGWGPTRTVAAATPPPLSITAPAPPSAHETLLTLAAVAARRARIAAPPTGRYGYVQRQTWELADQSDGSHRASHPLYRVITGWRAADGSGRRVTVAQTGSGTETTSVTLAAGDPPPSLSGSMVQLAHRLHLGYPSREPLGEQFLTMTALADAEPVPAAAEAKILRLLARVPGLVDAGTTTDRAGRSGTAIACTSSFTGTPIRYELVFDSATGGLLESDQTLIGDPGTLDVANGALLAYTTYRAVGRTASTTAAPTGATAP